MVTVANGFELSRCLKEMSALEANLHMLLSTLTEAQFQAPPRMGGWSIGHCIDHLVLAGRAFLPVWDAALQFAEPSAAPNLTAYSWWQRRILQLTEPPYRWKAQATKSAFPSARLPMDVTLHRFFAMHQELAKRMRSADGLDVSRRRVRSPFRSWVRYPLCFSFDLALAHERRHVWQAWQIRKQFDPIRDVERAVS